MDVRLDHALEVQITGPKPTAKGPDRATANVALRIGDQGYAILPIGQQTRLLPVSEALSFVGVPPLVGSLAGTQYVVSGRAFTGELDGTPRSVVGLLATTTSSEPIRLNRFVEIPELENPGTNDTWDGVELSARLSPGGASVELTVYEIQSGAGLVGWLVAAPGGPGPVRLPDLRALDGELALVPGPIAISVTAAHIDDFVYGSLRYRQLDRRGWNAHATDVFFAHY